MLLQCAFYFMNVAIDTTLGVYIAYLLLQLVTAFAVRSFFHALSPSFQSHCLWLIASMNIANVLFRCGAIGRV